MGNLRGMTGTRAYLSVLLRLPGNCSAFAVDDSFLLFVSFRIADIRGPAPKVIWKS